MTITKLNLQGVDCSCDAGELESVIRSLPGIESCEVHFTTGKMVVEGQVEETLLVQKIQELGYQVLPTNSSPAQLSAGDDKLSFPAYLWAHLDTRAALAAAFILLPAIIFGELLGVQALWVAISAVTAFLLAAFPIMRKALRALRRREITIDVLMTSASVGALLIGAFVEAGMVMVLFALGEALEGYTNRRARASIRSLLTVMPFRATVLVEHKQELHEKTMDVADLQIGDVILVRPGERIPMDGRIRSGFSQVNQAPITGESRLVAVEPGSEVFASSINGSGSLEIVVDRLAIDNTLSRMIALVQDAQEKRAPAQRFVDRFASVYTPAVVILAMLVAVVPPLLWGGSFFNPADGSTGWLYRGLAMLVVACPCALVISTPVSLVSAISHAARMGVLIKGGLQLEQLSKVKSIAFDKTGTLTLGQPAVVAVRALGCQLQGPETGASQVNERCDPCDDLIGLASSVERRSEHPLALALLAESEKRGMFDAYPPAEQVTAKAGRGITGMVGGRRVTLGNHPSFEADFPHPEWHCEWARRDAARGYTTVMLSVEDAYRGSIALADVLRESSQEAVKRLSALGIEKQVMLTGDEEGAARSMARQAGLSDVRSGLLPEQKVEAVLDLRRVHGSVTMVGDGINDTPALAAADVGVALAGIGSGTAQAMEVADVTILGDDLTRFPFLIRLSRAAMQTIWTNILLSIGIKLAFLGLVLLGIGTMWMAVLADMGTSLLVTLNGMRLLNRPKA